MSKLYLAYGSNMSKAQMARRCPNARALRAIYIEDARLVFRGVADIEYCKGAKVPVALWEITETCERSLDKFEGVASGVYEKKMIPLDNGEQALTYVMCSNGIAPPTREYYERIKRGYADFGVDLEALDVALKHSYVKQAHSPETRRHMVRNIAQGNALPARRPNHVPLSAIEPPSQGNLDLDRERFSTPVGRPLDEGYNWSHKARANSAPQRCGPHCQCEACEYKKRAERRAKAGHKDGKPQGRKMHSVGHDVEEVEAATRVFASRKYKRSNTRVTKTRQNLSDYLKEKGYN